MPSSSVDEDSVAARTAALAFVWVVASSPVELASSESVVSDESEVSDVPVASSDEDPLSLLPPWASEASEPLVSSAESAEPEASLACSSPCEDPSVVAMACVSSDEVSASSEDDALVTTAWSCAEAPSSAKAFPGATTDPSVRARANAASAEASPFGVQTEFERNLMALQFLGSQSTCERRTCKAPV